MIKLSKCFLEIVKTKTESELLLNSIIFFTNSNNYLSICKTNFTFDKILKIMSNKLLLPNRYKFIGWCLLIPATILGLILCFNDFEAFEYQTKVFAILNQGIMSDSKWFGFLKTNISNTVVGVLFIVGAMFVGFSKEKKEDEFIEKIRLSSLLWAVWVNYGLLILGFLLFYQIAFVNVMLYNMFTVLIIFIVRFNYVLYKSNKTVPDEK